MNNAGGATPRTALQNWLDLRLHGETKEAAGGKGQTQKKRGPCAARAFSVGGQKGGASTSGQGLRREHPCDPGDSRLRGYCRDISGPLSMGLSVLTKGWPSLSMPSSSLLRKEWGHEGNTSALVIGSLTDMRSVRRPVCEHTDTCTLIYLPGRMEGPLSQRRPTDCRTRFPEPFCPAHWPSDRPDGDTTAVSVGCTVRLAFSVFLVLFPIPSSLFQPLEFRWFVRKSHHWYTSW